MRLKMYRDGCIGGENAYTLIAISNSIAAIGIMKSPSQNTGDENMIVSIPTKTAASGIDGQKLLFREKTKFVQIAFDPRSEWRWPIR